MKIMCAILLLIVLKYMRFLLVLKGSMKIHKQAWKIIEYEILVKAIIIWIKFYKEYIVNILRVNISV